MAKDDNTPVTLTMKDLRALVREAVQQATQPALPAGAIGPEITKRPYRTITHPTEKGEDGKALVLCATPDDHGPLAINGMHPDDYFEVDDKGVATVNAPGQPIVAKAAPAVAPLAASTPPADTATHQPATHETAAPAAPAADTKPAGGV